MKYIDLKTYKKIVEQSKETEITEIEKSIQEAKNLFEDSNEIAEPEATPTKEAKKAQEILDSATIMITLKEREQLEEEAKKTEITEIEKSKKEARKLFKDSNEIVKPEATPTKEAKKAQEILNNAKTIITLEERKQLEEEAKKTEITEIEKSKKEARSLFEDSNEIAEPEATPTKEAKKAQEILNSAKTMITLEERNQLEEEAKKTEISEIEKLIQEAKSLFEDSNEIVEPEATPTKEAKKAQEILNSATIMITLKERNQLEEDAKKTEIEKSIKEAKSLFEDGNEIVETESTPTKEAKRAQEILDGAITMMTLEERMQLEEEAKKTEITEIEKSIQEARSLFEDGNEIVETELTPTKEATMAKNVLEASTLISDSKIRTITPEQIGKVSFEALKNNMKEILEEQKSQERGIDQEREID